jgi:hypothetical protein
MISFLDLFKWDRFVATSFIEVLFWLLTAIAVLLGVAGVIDGVAQVSVDPARGLFAIALSILGGLAAIVVARTLCEAAIMLFRVNENLMDIRDNLAAANERHAPAVPLAPEPVVNGLSFAQVLEEALAEPDPASMMPPPPPELDYWLEPPVPEQKPAEPKSPETSSLEARLAEIRARREAAASAMGVNAAAPATSHPEKTPPAVGKGGFAASVVPAPVPPVAVTEGRPTAAGSAPEVRPAARPAEPNRAESKKPDENKAVAGPVVGPLAGSVPGPTPPTVQAAEKQVDDASKMLVREAEATVDKPKADDAG